MKATFKKVTAKIFHGRQRASIAAGRAFIERQAPELKPIEKLKYKITTKSQIDVRPPGTAADSKLKLIVTTSSPACSNTFVSGWLSFS